MSYFQNTPIINDILDITKLEFCDPTILSAACKFAFYVLENNNVEEDPKSITMIS